MNVLTNRSYRQYDYTSRYAGFPYYYHTLDETYVYGITGQLQDTSYISHNVKQTDNLDYLSFLYYGRPDYYGIIADFNKIPDPYIQLSETFDTLKIPNIAGINFGV